MSTPNKIKALMANDANSSSSATATAVARVAEVVSTQQALSGADEAPAQAALPTASPMSGTPVPNEAPLVVDEWINVTAGQAVSAHQSVLLANDRDTDGGVLSIAELGTPAHGILTKADDGTLTYVANADYSGVDSFTYKVSDGQGGFTTGTVHINVEPGHPVNKPPVVVDEWANVRGSNPISAHESLLLANDRDPEGGALSVRNLSDPPHGTLTRAADGTLTYQADPGFTGIDTFTYDVVDPQGNVTVGTVHLCVLPATLSVTITDVRDDVRPTQGTVADEGRTDDRRPALQGQTEAGALVDIYDGSTKLGQVSADSSGQWSFTPTTDLGDGRHDFKALATAVDGLTAQSNEWSVIVDCTTTPPPPPPPPPPPLPAPTVVIGEDSNNDGLISRAENTGRADAIVTLSQGAKVGDTLIVTDQGGAEQRKLLTAADINSGTVTFTDSFAMPADGERLTLTAQIQTSEGVLSQKGTDTALVDTTAPGNPVITITTDSDNNGRINQGELNAAGGVDLRVDLPLSAKAGDKLTIVDQAGNKIEITLTAAQIEAKSVSFDNAFPTPAQGATLTVTATLTDPAGNVSGPSSDSALIEQPVVNQPPVGTADENTVQALATPVARFFVMNQNTGDPEAAGQTWVTTDGDAGRAVYGSLSSLLAPGMKVQISSSDRPGQWIDAVVSSDGLRWTAVDALAHSADWIYSARVVGADGGVLSESAVQQVSLLPGAPLIDSFGTAVGDRSIAVGGETTDQTLVINGRAADGAASVGHTIEVFANGLSHPVGTAVVKADGTWSLDLTATPLRDGDYNFYARDAEAQNTWSQAASLQVETPDVSRVAWENWGIAGSYNRLLPEAMTQTLSTSQGDIRMDVSANDVYIDITSKLVYANEPLSAFVPPASNGGASLVYAMKLIANSLGYSDRVSLNFDRPIENLDLLVTTYGKTQVLAWDADGKPVIPQMVSLLDGDTRVQGSYLVNDSPYWGGYGVIQLQGSYSRVEFLTEGALALGVGAHIPREGLNAGVDDGSILPSLAQGAGPNADVLSYASQNELDQAIASGALDGGGGLDTLRLTGQAMTLDLTRYSSVPGTPQEVNNVEKFDLGSRGNNLVMSVNDVLAQGQTNAFVVNGRTQVMVLGGDTDQVGLAQLLGHGGDSGTWLAAGTVQVDGVTYNVFNHSTLAAQVLVKLGVAVDLPAGAGTPGATTDTPAVSGQVLTNDTDPDGPEDQLRVAGVDNNAGVTQGENLGQRIEGKWGHLTLQADGTYTYVADKTQALTSVQDDVFYYRLVDAQGLLSAEPTTLTIRVTPSAAKVTSVSDATVVEGGDLVFTVDTSLSPLATTMQLNLQSGSATVGVDTNGPLQVNFGQGWVDVVGNQVNVPAGTTSYQVRVQTVDDLTIESRETVTLTVGTSTVATLQGTGTIVDNDLLGGVARGTEDTPLTLNWGNFNLTGVATATSLKITQLPDDGTLKYNDNGTWRAVSLNQQFTKAEVEAGKLSFTPDAHESGVDAYGIGAVGNKLNDYARIGFTAFDQQGRAFNEAVVTVDIAPIADLGTLDVRAIQPLPNSGGSDHYYSFLVSGASPDMDGSERTRIAVKLTSGQSIYIVDGDTGRENIAFPDANGVYWLDVNDRVHVLVSAGNYTSGFQYALYREDVNKDGVVLDSANTPFKQASFYGTPLVLDLNGDGVQTAGMEQGVHFDLNADGQREQTGWTDGKDGLLVLDRNGNGRIDNGTELFGDATKLNTGETAKDGFAALADLDSNGDGVVTAADDQFANLQVWVDSNQDGQTQAGELLGLGAVGVVSLNLNAQQTEVLQNGNIIGLTSSFTKADGSTHELSDVWFQTRDARSDADDALNAKDLLTGNTLHEVCSGDPKGLSLPEAQVCESPLAAHSLQHHRAAFERWDEPSHAML